MGCTNNALAFFVISTINVAITLLFSLGGGGGGGGGYPPSPLCINPCLLEVPCITFCR